MMLSPSWKYGIGAGLLTMPVAILVVVTGGAAGVDDGDPWHWLLLLTYGSGATGMCLGAVLGFHITRPIRSQVVRAVALAVIVPGFAFPIAALPFLLFYVVGALVAWALGVAWFGVYAFVLALAWSAIFLRWQRQDTVVPPPGRARSAFHIGAGTVGVLLGLATQYIAIMHMMHPPARHTEQAPVASPLR